MKAYDIEIVELSTSVIFYACLPPTYLSLSPLAADWKEEVEVSIFLKSITVVFVDHFDDSDYNLYRLFVESVEHSFLIILLSSIFISFHSS